MSEYVLTDAALMKYAGRFVWLSIDTEVSANATFLEKFPPEGIPTLLVIDASTEKVALKWLGSANVEQLSILLEQSEKSVQTKGKSPYDKALANADRLYGEGKNAEAVVAYRDTLKLAGSDPKKRGLVLTSLIGAQQSADDARACAKLARDEGPTLPRGPAFASVVSAGLGCSLNESWGAEYREVLLPLVEEAVVLESVLEDDRSSLYGLLVSAYQEKGDKAGAKRMAETWLEFLEGVAAKAPSALARTAFDSHRVSAALEIGHPERVVDPLKLSELELPNDYNAPYRLMMVYRELGRDEDAIAAGNRALQRVYGPRKIRVLETLAGVYVKQSDVENARKTLNEALVYATSLPLGQLNPKTVDRLKKQLTELL